MRFRSPAVLLPSTVLLALAASANTASSQAAGTWVCTALDSTRQMGFVSQVFNVSQADAPKVSPAWIAALRLIGVVPPTPPTCHGYTKFAAADSVRKQFIAFVSNSLEERINQMDWTYAAAPRATADAPVAVASTTAAGGSNAAQAEMSQAKAYCVQNHSGMYDCDGFAKAVAEHRRANPNEYVRDNSGPPRIAPIHDLESGIQHHLDCTSCLNDQMLASWARQNVEHQFSEVVISKLRTQASVDTYADCVAKAFVPKMHARPNVEDYLKNFNDASVGCGSPH